MTVPSISFNKFYCLGEDPGAVLKSMMEWTGITNQQAVMITQPRSLMMLYTLEQTPWIVIQIKTVSLFLGNPQNNDQILTL